MVNFFKKIVSAATLSLLTLSIAELSSSTVTCLSLSLTSSNDGSGTSLGKTVKKIAKIGLGFLSTKNVTANLSSDYSDSGPGLPFSQAIISDSNINMSDSLTTLCDSTNKNPVTIFPQPQLSNCHHPSSYPTYLKLLKENIAFYYPGIEEKFDSGIDAEEVETLNRIVENPEELKKWGINTNTRICSEEEFEEVRRRSEDEMMRKGLKSLGDCPCRKE